MPDFGNTVSALGQRHNSKS